MARADKDGVINSVFSDVMARGPVRQHLVQTVPVASLPRDGIPEADLFCGVGLTSADPYTASCPIRNTRRLSSSCPLAPSHRPFTYSSYGLAASRFLLAFRCFTSRLRIPTQYTRRMPTTAPGLSTPCLRPRTSTSSAAAELSGRLASKGHCGGADDGSGL